MIGKIDPKNIFGLKSSRLDSPPSKREKAGFDQLLKERLDEGPNSLEAMVIESLKRTLDMILSLDNGHEDELGLDFSPFFPLNPSIIPQGGSRENLSVSLPPPPTADLSKNSILLPSQPEIQYTAPASNNLQEGQDFEQIVNEAGWLYGVQPSLIKAVIKTESDGNPFAVSRAGAKGLMQLMPGTALDLGVSNPFDPAQNIMAGTRYLRQLLNRYQGDLRLTLAAYNWGMGNLERKPEAMPKETRDYIVKVENRYRNYYAASSQSV
jgi:hypothetical protein